VHATSEDVRGGSIERCSAAFNEILGGERSPRADVVALNAAVALYIAGHVPTVAAGFEIAKSILANCQALEVFERAKIIARESGMPRQPRVATQSAGSSNG
jgi:anthranilate phosphoribosyltransferase